MFEIISILSWFILEISIFNSQQIGMVERIRDNICNFIPFST